MLDNVLLSSSDKSFNLYLKNPDGLSVVSCAMVKDQQLQIRKKLGQYIVIEIKTENNDL